jgi:hypothetical protein
MINILAVLLPAKADNTIRAMKLPFYVFAAIAIVGTVRSCIHLLAPDGGAGSIAGMDLSAGRKRPRLYRDPAAMSRTPFSGAIAGHVTEGLVARPSRAAGLNYDAVSRAYAHSLHSVLTKECGVQAALAQLEGELIRITG